MKWGARQVSRKMWQFLALLVFILSLAAALIPVSSLRIDNSLEIWFYENDPSRKAYDLGHRVFGNWDWMSIYVEPTNGVYDAKFLETLRELTAKLEGLADVRKVISVANARGNLLEQNELSYQPILGSPPWTPEWLAQVRTTLETNLIYRKALVQPGSGKDSTILLQVNNREMDRDAYRISLVNNIQAIFDEYSAPVKYYALAGTPYLNAELDRSSRHDMYVFIPLVTLLVTVMAWFVFGNLRDVAITVATLSGVTIWSVGLMMLKYDLNMVTIMMPTILVTVSVANVMHMIVSFHLLRREHPSWKVEKAVKTVMKDLWAPSLGATTTTAVGFLSLVQADILPITLLGYFSALGIMFAYLLTFTLLPLLLLVCWGDSTKTLEVSQAATNRSLFHRISLFSIVSKTSLAHPLVTLGVFVVIGGGICAGIPRLDADTNYVNLFTDKTQVKSHYQNIEQAGYATNSVTMLVAAPNGLEDIATFRSVITLEQEIVKLPLTRTVIGPGKILAEVDRALAVDKSTWVSDFAGYSREAIAQLMLTSEISGNDDLRDALSLDHKYFQLTIFSGNLSSREVMAYSASLNKLAQDILPSGVKAEVTGTPLLWANMDHHLLVSQNNILVSVLLPLALIMLCLVRSLPLVIIGLIVNLLPVGLILGQMGWLGLKINLATILIGGITMGIAVDDTMHFLWHYRTQIKNGKPFTEALMRTYQHTGTAICMTAILLSLGFLVMAASDFVPTADFGRLTSLTIIIAFATEILLMPTLLYLLDWATGRAHLRAAVPEKPI